MLHLAPHVRQKLLGGVEPAGRILGSLDAGIGEVEKRDVGGRCFPPQMIAQLGLAMRNFSVPTVLGRSCQPPRSHCGRPRAHVHCVLDGSVHAFDLTVGPRVLGLSQAMIDIVLSAGEFEGVRPDGLSGALMSGAAELALPGVVKWVPLSVRTVWTL
jgi:hypothetical protein